jgi:poly-beta-1,6-N-acetyl-D-glucosamine synthase
MGIGNIIHWSWYIPAGILLIYSLRIFTYLAGWRKSIKNKDLSILPYSRASVIIPFRNEENKLSLLLDSLAKQDYPEEYFEVILIDDHSDDRSVEIVKSFIELHENFKLYFLKESGNGKKNALKLGMQMAGGKIILTSDADCRIGQAWISEMVREINQEGVRMVLGAVNYYPVTGLFQKMQSLEFLSLIGTAAGSSGAGRPVLCNAASLSFYRDDYLEYQKEEDHRSPSGDDMFLMLWIKKKWPGAIRFCNSLEAIVYTSPVKTAGAFIRQRIRWSSKNRFFKDKDVIITSALVYLSNLCLLGSLLYGCIHPPALFLFVLLFLVKSISDFIFLSAVAKYYHVRKLLWWFLPLQIIYFVYVSITGLVGQVIPYSWKGRRISSFGNRSYNEVKI